MYLIIVSWCNRKHIRFWFWSSKFESCRDYNKIWRISIAVSTLGFQPKKRSSILRCATKLKLCTRSLIGRALDF